MSERIQKLKKAVEHAHKGCRAHHEGSAHIKEMHDGASIWEGVVESFEIKGHPRAARCYAWSYQTGAETHYTTVLELPPVTSAQTAVQASIVAKHRLPAVDFDS